MMIKKFIIFVLFLPYTLCIPAQSPFFENLKTIKNKKNYVNNIIFQDSQGFIWIGSTLGLIKYDGVSFNLFTKADGLNDNNITAIAENNDREIWIGHKNGKIDILKKGKIHLFNPEEGHGTCEISNILFNNNTLWFATKGEGIYYYKGKNRLRLYNLNTDDGLNDNYIYQLAVSPDHKIYAGTDNGISIIDTASGKVIDHISMKNGLPDNIVKCLHFDTSNLLWIGMEDNGICSYDLKSRKFNHINPWPFGTINSFIERKPGQFWVSTLNNGVIKISFNQKQNSCYKQFVTAQGLQSNHTENIFLDREYNIWIACADGITKAPSNLFEFIDKRDGFDIHNIYSFICDKQNNYWVASESGLFRYKNFSDGSFEKKLIIDQKPISNSFVSLYQDSTGYIWAGTYGYGVFRINPENLNFMHFSSQNGLSNDNILSITGKGNKVWLSTLGGGAIVCDIKNNLRFSTFSQTNGLSGNYIYNTFIDSHNRIWFSHDGNGFSVIENGIVKKSYFPDSIKDNTIYSITEDKTGNIWFLTSGKGLIYFDGTIFKSLNESNGLRTNNIRGISADNDSNIVIISNDGIDIYNPQKRTFKYHGEENGVAYLEPNLNAVSTDNNGNIWIGTQNGAVRILPTCKAEDTISPKILLTKRMLFFNDFDESIHSFGYKQNHISFEYIGLWYKCVSEINYRYKLDNYDLDWSKETKSREVTYSNLPPGNYTFNVEVSNQTGIWKGSNDAIFSFEIKPPFWKTWWFISIAIILFGFSIYSFIKGRLAVLQNAKLKLEEEVRKRTAEIMLQKEEIETQRDEIEQQRDYVTGQRDQIALQNQHITESIMYASRIQKALMPPINLFEQTLPDFFILFRPMDIVSGDFYWIGVKPERIVIAAGDCTGHGVPGALMSMLGVSLLNQIFNLSKEFDASEYMELMRAHVKMSLRQKYIGGESNESIDAALIVINKEQNELQFSGAYNPLFLVRNGELTIIPAVKTSLGLSFTEDEIPFTNHRVPLQKGDCLYLFSDGYSDQLGGPKENKFKSKNFINLIVSVSNLPMNEQKEIINKTMNDWKGDLKLNDDILVIGIKI